MAWVHALLGGFSVQQMEKMRGERFAVGICLDSFAVVREVVPVEKHGRLRGQQRVGDRARAGFVVVVGFRPQAAQNGDAGAQHVHGVRVAGSCSRACLTAWRQTAQAEQALFVCSQFRGGGQLAVD
jgi:hypothetical protein